MNIFALLSWAFTGILYVMWLVYASEKSLSKAEYAALILLGICLGPAMIIVYVCCLGRMGLQETESSISGSSWNNRIFVHTNDETGNESYGLHETFYNCFGEVDGYTADSMIGHFDSPEELIRSLEMMLQDAKRFKNDILVYKEDD